MEVGHERDGCVYEHAAAEYERPAKMYEQLTEVYEHREIFAVPLTNE